MADTSPLSPYAERLIDPDVLVARAAELLDRARYLATASALPGDEAVRWLECREEALDLLSDLSIGLHFMAVPE